MSNTQQRLDAYIAAEARILSVGFSVRMAERQRQEAELERIQKWIDKLTAQLAAETGSATSPSTGSLRYKTAVFS